MKKIYVALLSFFALCSFGQNINDYEFVLIPTQFEFQKVENDYRLNTLLKYRLEEYGFQVNYTSTETDAKFSDRCLYLTANVVNESSLFLIKLAVVFNDCNGKIIFKSTTGTSKIKDRKLGYTEALEDALKSVAALNYKFEGKKSEQVVTTTKIETPAVSPKETPKETLTKEPVATANKNFVETPVEKIEKVAINALFAQPITNGYQLVDTTPKVVLKMFKTSQTDVFVATSGAINGVVLKKNNEWFFEYYSAEKLVSEKLSIKF